MNAKSSLSSNFTRHIEKAQQLKKAPLKVVSNFYLDNINLKFIRGIIAAR